MMYFMIFLITMFGGMSVVFALLFGPEPEDRVHAERTLNGDEAAKAAVAVLEFLKRERCNIAQGFLLGELAERVSELRRSRRPAPELLAEFVDGIAGIATQRLPNFPALLVRGILGTGRIAPKLLPLMAEILTGMREVISRGIREGSLRKADPTAAYMNLIGGLDRVTSGSVTVADTDLATLSPARLSDLRLHRIGFVFQAFNLIPVLSARENVEFVMQVQGVPAAERRGKSLEILEEVGLEGLEAIDGVRIPQAHRLPDVDAFGHSQFLHRSLIHHQAL